jgi:activator of HSP90 ATPase
MVDIIRSTVYGIGIGAEYYIPDLKSEMFDISHLPDDQIKGAILLRVLFEKLHDIFKLYQQLSNKTTTTEYLEVLLRYLVPCNL